MFRVENKSKNSTNISISEWVNNSQDDRKKRLEMRKIMLLC